MYVSTETGHGETVCKIPTQENVSLFVECTTARSERSERSYYSIGRPYKAIVLRCIVLSFI